MKLPANISGTDYREEVITTILKRTDQLQGELDIAPYDKFAVAVARLHEAKFVLATCLPQIEHEKLRREK